MTVGFANIMGHQVQAPFLQTREIFEVRERMSRIYKWTALITAQLLAELPIDVFFSILYFLTWYWTNGFPSDRGGYSFAMIGIIFPLQVVVSRSLAFYSLTV
jgi:ATP-binding cassette, subfamily G (WHITE), member 2, PDR